jgi:hypothetical protein
MNLDDIRPKLSKPPCRKPNSVKELEQLATSAARLKHPSLPLYALAPRTFRDDTANGLTACITSYISLMGGWASRINSQGTYRAKLGRYTPGTARRGLADIMGTYRATSLHIEVKIGQDRQSEAQKLVESEVTRSGGLYYIARNFSEFKDWFDNKI